MNPGSEHPRVDPPAGGDNRDLREHGRQLAMDALLQQCLRPASAASVRAVPVAPKGRRWWLWPLSGAAAAAAVLAAVFLRPPGDVEPPPDEAGAPAAALAPGWTVRPTGDAEFRLAAPDRIRLERGELRIASAPLADPSASRAGLIVETPDASASASGTDFVIGTHLTSAGGTSVKARLTRVLVLAGAVTLANSLGRASGSAGELLAAESGAAPVNCAVKANGAFAVDLYLRLAAENPGRNVFFSPYSASAALAMVVEGARGATAEEMGRALRLPEAARRVGADSQLLPWNTLLLHTGMAELHQRFNGADRAVPAAVRERIAALRKAFDAAEKERARLMEAGQPLQFAEATEKARKIAGELNPLLAQIDLYELRTANRLWVERTSPLRAEYLEPLKAHYGTGMPENVDFRGDPEAARRLINRWCAEQTKGRISEPLREGAVDKATRLVLANAIYFLGQWSEPFDAKDTGIKPFAAAGGPVRVPLMENWVSQARFAAFNADGTPFAAPTTVPPGESDSPKWRPASGGFQMAELPYKGGDLSMVVLVPTAADGLDKLEGMLTAERLAGWLGALQARRVHVLLPKFRMETDYDLIPALRGLGLSTAFDSGKADFSGMSDSPAGLFLSAVRQKAFVSVDEKGTEAVAVTIIAVDPTAGPPEAAVPYTPTVRADRPFLFLIRDLKTGTILFLGRVTNPA